MWPLKKVLRKNLLQTSHFNIHPFSWLSTCFCKLIGSRNTFWQVLHLIYSRISGRFSSLYFFHNFYFYLFVRYFFLASLALVLIFSNFTLSITFAAVFGIISFAISMTLPAALSVNTFAWSTISEILLLLVLAMLL